MSKFWIIETYHSFSKSHLAVQIRIVSCVEYFVNSQELYLASASFKKVATLNTVTPLTVNSVRNIILQVWQNFHNTAVFKTYFEITFCLSSFENCMYLKLTQFNSIFRKEL